MNRLSYKRFFGVKRPLLTKVALYPKNSPDMN